MPVIGNVARQGVSPSLLAVQEIFGMEVARFANVGSLACYLRMMPLAVTTLVTGQVHPLSS
jgi:hypothetical protein